ncbi:MAG TPA: enoyl-CoA hydratase-related protein [Ktedonobacterales bacterium]
MDFSALLFEVRDHVAHITLNRPQAANTLNVEMGMDLMRAALRCEEDRSVRSVLLSGSGAAFCAGGDLKAFHAHLDGLPAHIKEVVTYLHTALSHLTRMNAPVVTAVHGFAAGAGLSLACASDLVVAGESARFTMAYTRAGLTPDGSATHFLPRVVGLNRALDLALTNRTLSAREAMEWGIVSRVVPDAEVHAQAEELAIQLAAGPTRAFGNVKRLMRTGWTETLETQMAYEADSIAEMTRLADGREGVTAFVEKRAPHFTGE